jgi:hypothetical protein
MIELREQYWALQVPHDAWILKSENYRTDFVINMGYLTYPTVGKKKWLELPGLEGAKLPGLDYNERAKGVIKLPPGTWEIVCTSIATPPEHVYEVIEHDGDGFKDYGAGPPENDYGPFVNIIDSLNSLLTSKGCDLNKNYLILKKQ